jgi:hypothetical protein
MPSCLQVVPRGGEAGEWLQLRAAVLNNLGYYFKARGKLDTALRWAPAGPGRAGPALGVARRAAGAPHSHVAFA